MFGSVILPSRMEDSDLQHGLFSMAKLLLVVMAIEEAVSHLQSGEAGRGRENDLKVEESHL